MADEQNEADRAHTKIEGGFRGPDTLESDKERETGGQGGRSSGQDAGDKKPLGSGGKLGNAEMGQRGNTADSGSQGGDRSSTPEGLPGIISGDDEESQGG